MRCPECTERNSVAARSCDACGYKFKRKPVPATVWAGIGIVATALTFWGVASAVVPSLTDPSKSLARVAKNFLAGPKNPEHATKLKREFDDAIKQFLAANGKDDSPELVKKLQTILVSNAFEVHSFDLPRGLRVIEVDTILQASDFLVMNTNSGTKVFTLPDLEVFDSAQVLNDHARNSLVLVGHSAGQGPRHPQVKVYALLPDDIQDETAAALPQILGEGTATFAPNHKDLIVDVSLFSVGVAQHLFKPIQPSIGRGEEERLKQVLTWKDGRYSAAPNHGKGALYALYSVARCMQSPADCDKYANFVSAKAANYIKSNSIKLDAPNFVIGQTETPSKQRRTPTVSRLLNGPPGNSFRVELQKAGDGSDAHVIASNIKPTDETVKPSKVKPPEMVATTSTPSGTNTANGTSVNNTAATGTTSVVTTSTVPVQVATIDPTLNHHQATIVEKKPSTKKENRTDIPIEDRIINSAKNVQPAKDSAQDHSIKETTKPAEKQSDSKDNQSGDSKKVDVVESKSKAVKYPVDEELSMEKIAETNINLRRGPSNGYRTLAHLKPGAKIEVIGKKDGWYKVRSGGTEGFIMISSVENSKKSAPATQTKPEPIAAVTKPEVAKPTKPDAKQTKPVTAQTSTSISNTSIKTASSIPSKPVSGTTKESGKSSTPKETVEPMQKGLTTGTLNRNRTIRDENHNAIGVASKGAKVVVLTGLKNGKYKVQLPNGKTGYVDKETVDVVNNAPEFVP